MTSCRRFATPALAALGLALIASSAMADGAPAPAGDLRTGVAFSDYTPLSSNAELVRRLLSPLTAAQVPRALARSGKVMAPQPVDLGGERFTIYVPSPKPSGGYGLLVFVPPWPEAVLPRGWGPVLDRFGLIFVSAARSGNEAPPLSRREPLALLAAANIGRRYALDPGRVYVAGFSGGSRMAMRLALAYPDVFRGALLDAGSDPIGEGEVPAPPRDLFERFQESTRLVYATGARDTAVLDKDAGSMASMRKWCVFDVESQVTALLGHDPLGAAALSRALATLTAPARPDPKRLAACRAGIERELTAKLRDVETLIARGKRGEARRLLEKVDRRFGGLAAPMSLDLANR